MSPGCPYRAGLDGWGGKERKKPEMYMEYASTVPATRFGSLQSCTPSLVEVSLHRNICM